jgi:hypothetical protein
MLKLESLEELFMTSNVLPGPILNTVGEVTNFLALDLSSIQQ